MFGRKVFILGNGVITENDYKKATIIGNGEIFGGSIRKLTSIGNSIISGALETAKTNSVGNISVTENMNVQLMKITGEGSFKKLFAKNLIVWGKVNNNNGSTRLKGDVSAYTFEVMGKCIVKSDLKVENIFVSSSLYIEKELQCENFECLGSIEAPSINAAHIYIYPRESSKVNELYASEVIIKMAFRECLIIKKHHTTWRHMRRFKHENSFINIEIIEADKIYLENTKAKLVSGKNVDIGPRCNIETVEYIDNLSIDVSSKVGKSVKI